MKTAKEFLKPFIKDPTDTQIELMIEFAREAIKADRENVAKYINEDMNHKVPVIHIINAPNIELL